jgi:hypothetical protein
MLYTVRQGTLFHAATMEIYITACQQVLCFHRPAFFHVLNMRLSQDSKKLCI